MSCELYWFIESVCAVVMRVVFQLHPRQVYSLANGRRDVETVYTMGIMEDVNLVPQPAGGESLAGRLSE